MFLSGWFRVYLGLVQVCLELVEGLFKVGSGFCKGLLSWDRFEVYLGFVWRLFYVNSKFILVLFEKFV